MRETVEPKPLTFNGIPVVWSDKVRGVLLVTGKQVAIVQDGHPLVVTRNLEVDMVMREILKDVLDCPSSRNGSCHA